MTGQRRSLHVRAVLLAAILLLISPTSGWANHVHMHGGPFLGVVLSVVVDPSKPAVVYIAAHGGGVFESRDGGDSWVAINNGLPNRRVFSLLLHSKKPGTLYVGTDQGIFQRTNHDGSWQPLAQALEKRNIRSLAADPQDPDLLYAATDQGVFAGKDHQWRHLSAGLLNKDVRVLEVSPSGAVFAGTFGGVYKKERNQNAWIALNRGLTDKRVRALVVDPSARGTLYAGTATGGVFKTSNGGKTWEEFNRGLLNSTVLSLIQLPDKSLYAGTVDGIFQSQHRRNQWWSVGGQDLAFTVATMAFDPTDPRRLYAGSGGRLFRSTDKGQTWRELGHRIDYFGTASQPAKTVSSGVIPK